jgi:1,4-alpha-glucan branching enzyme
MWKEKSEFACMRGIKLQEIDEATNNKMLEIISAAGNIYIDSFLYGEGLKREEEKFKEKSSEETEIISIKKQYLDTTPTCKVTFRLPQKAAPEAQKVTIVGDFNGWDKERTLMGRLESGDFTVTLELKTGNEYKFKYLIDASRWENDWHADKYIPCPHGYDDSVVVV